VFLALKFYKQISKQNVFPNRNSKISQLETFEIKHVAFTEKKVSNFQPKLFPNCCRNSQVVPNETVSVFFSE